ncbi:MAG: extracellular solute-binding protein [Pseudomonadota bacterium]
MTPFRRFAARTVLGLLVASLPWTTITAQNAADDEGLTRLTQFAEFGEPVYPEGFTHFDYVNLDAPEGGHVRLAAYGTFERINPIPLGPAWPQGLGLLYDSLMTGSGDELAAYYPSIAKSVSVPDDVSFAIFELDSRARWHDGEPITADDFVFSLEVIKEHARPLLREFWRNLEAATALPDGRLRIDFATTDNWKTLGLAASLGPQPRHFYEANDLDPGAISTEPEVYEGPYRIERVDIGRSITYRRVDDYWAADLPVNRGQNNFERITYVYFRDLDVAFEAFKSGDISFWSENEARRWATGYDLPQVRDGRIVRDETIPLNNPRGFAGLVINTRRPPFDDVRVREALGLLFDFEWTQTNILYGLYERARSYFPNSDYGTRDVSLPTAEELAILEPFRDRIPEDVFTEPFEVNVTDGSGRIRGELRRAWQLFAEAGWVVEEGQLRSEADGSVMRLQIVTSTQAALRYIEPYVTNLRRAGIDASVRVVDTAQYQRLTDDFDYDMVAIGANFFPPPNEELNTYYSSAAADERGSGNWAGVKDPVVDELLAELVDVRGRSNADLERLKAITRALDRVLLRGHYVVHTFYSARNRLAYWNYLKHPEVAPVYGTGFPPTWWYDATTAPPETGDGR